VAARSGLPLLAICPIGHNRLIPFRLLKTSETDRTPLYGRPFKCKACGSREVILFSIDSHARAGRCPGGTRWSTKSACATRLAAD
jgi:hypothetical protein